MTYDNIIKDLKNIFGSNCWIREEINLENNEANDELINIKKDWFNKLGENIICIIDCDNDGKDLDYYNLYSGSEKLQNVELKYSINHEWENEWLAYIYYQF